MKIDRVSLTNFLAFKGLPFSFLEDFIGGINVIIGANATGKSTLLRSIYAACEFSNQKLLPGKGKRFQDYFSASRATLKDINHVQDENRLELIEIFSKDYEFHYRVWEDTFLDLDQWLKLGIKSVLIPSAEMLSHSKGLVAMSEKYGVPFDQTQIDILINAQIWETKEISERNQLLLDKLSKAIDGVVVYENDTFYVVKNNGLIVEFSMEAEGLKRLGLLWKLIRNGLLEPGAILLWDEPESSVHPEYMALIAEVLHTLAQDGVQVFVATHSYTFAKYIDLQKKSAEDVLFISLYKENNTIKSSRAYHYSNLSHNAIEASGDALYDAVLEKTLEEVRNDG